MAQTNTNPILLCGIAPWSEVGFGQDGRDDCPVCHDRDFERERRRRLNRLCLRCMSWTWDFAFHHPRPPGRPWLAKADARRLNRRMRRQARGAAM